MPASDIRQDVNFHAACSFLGGFYPPAGALNNSHFAPDANNRLAASKQVHRIDLHYAQPDGADVAAETKLLRVCRGSAAIVGIEVRPTAVPAGGDKGYSIDVQKAADGSNTWSSLLDAAVAITSADAADTNQAADMVDEPTLSAGDALRIVVATSGSTGTQGQGFTVSIYVEEQPS